MGSFVVREDEKEYGAVDWGKTKNLFGPENVGTQYLRVNITEYAPGTEHKLHRHPTRKRSSSSLREKGSQERWGHRSAGLCIRSSEHGPRDHQCPKSKPMRAITSNLLRREKGSNDHFPNIP
jgi:hypothetical protein